MTQLLLKLIDQLNGAVFVLVVILLLALWFCYKIGGIVKTFSGIEKRNDRFDENLDNIKEGLFSVKATVELLYKKELSTMQTKSPVSLSPKGEEVSEKINAVQKIANHWPEIKNLVGVDNILNPYDIQTIVMDKAQKCFDGLFTEQEKSEIKLYAFNVGMNLMEIYPVLGIIIRDKLLREKGINVNDIDKHDPNRK